MDRLISEMKREERSKAIEYLKTYRKLDENLHNSAPIDSVSYYATDKCLKYWDMAIKALQAIPSAEPKTGHWIIIDDCEYFIAKCSECGRREDSRMISLYPYCHCGAKMVDPQESEG